MSRFRSMSLEAVVVVWGARDKGSDWVVAIELEKVDGFKRYFGGR